MAKSDSENFRLLQRAGGDADGEAEKPELIPIPLPNFPLEQYGEAAYWEWCVKLRDLALLDELMIMDIEMFAIAEDAFHKALRQGKHPARYHLETRRSFTQKMGKIIGNDKPHQPARKENTYARFGFAERSRRRRHGSA